MPSTPKNLTSQERHEIVLFLLENSFHGLLSNNLVAETSERFQCHSNTIRLIWRRWLDPNAPGEGLSKVDSYIKKKCGRKAVYDYTELTKRIVQLPIRKRSTIRDMAGALHVSHNTISRLMKTGLLHRHNSRVKPKLKPKHYLQRLKFALSKIHPITMNFDCMENVVVIDEKIFYHDKDKRKMYLVAGEEPPERSCENKRFIGSSMFLAAVARPR